jgi:predicted XRE-type DNA-binding protein
MPKRNPRLGSSFDDFLKAEGVYDEVHAKALKRVLAEQIEESMAAASLSKARMATLMATSRSQLDRVLDPDNISVQLDTLVKAARAVGKTVQITLRRAKKPAPA